MEETGKWVRFVLLVGVVITKRKTEKSQWLGVSV